MNKDLEKLKEEYQNVKMTDIQKKEFEKTIKRAKEERMRTMKYQTVKKFALAAAGLAIVFVVSPNVSENIANAMEKIPVLGNIVNVVTFREYHYKDDKHIADIKVPEVEVKDDKKDVVNNDKEGEKLKETTQDINAEIKEITNQLETEFKENLKKNKKEGYQSLDVKSEVIATTPELFTLKLVCFSASASGYEKNYYYTINLATEERLTLNDLFVKDADYEKVISDNIKQQMREQMKTEDKPYFIDSDMPDWDFTSIKKDQAFYINEKNNLVICFDEAEVAPAYLGCVEFEIPSDVLKDIRVMK